MDRSPLFVSCASSASLLNVIFQTEHEFRNPANVEPQNCKQRPYQSYGKMKLTIAIPCLGCNYNFTFYIADVNDNIQELDFVKDKDINTNCCNLTVTDNVTKFTSTRNNSPAPTSQSPVLAVSLDMSQITVQLSERRWNSNRQFSETPI